MKQWICKISMIFQDVDEILADFQQIFTEFCRNFCKFHGISSLFRMFMNFRGSGKKPSQKPGQKPRKDPAALPLDGNFGGRRRTLPWKGGGKKKTKFSSLRCPRGSLSCSQKVLQLQGWKPLTWPASETSTLRRRIRPLIRRLC